jgi:hypothetical protein
MNTADFVVRTPKLSPVGATKFIPIDAITGSAFSNDLHNLAEFAAAFVDCDSGLILGFNLPRALPGVAPMPLT